MVLTAEWKLAFKFDKAHSDVYKDNYLWWVEWDPLPSFLKLSKHMVEDLV